MSTSKRWSWCRMADAKNSSNITHLSASSQWPLRTVLNRHSTTNQHTSRNSAILYFSTLLLGSAYTTQPARKLARWGGIRRNVKPWRRRSASVRRCQISHFSCDSTRQTHNSCKRSERRSYGPTAQPPTSSHRLRTINGLSMSMRHRKYSCTWRTRRRPSPRIGVIRWCTEATRSHNFSVRPLNTVRT